MKIQESRRIPAASRQMCGIIVVEGEVEEQSVKQWRGRGFEEA